MNRNFLMKATKSTPYLNLDPSSGLITIKGKMTPENSQQLFQPIMEWLDEYIMNPSLRTQLNIHLDYFNTSSSKFLLDIFRRLEKVNRNDSDVSINWICEKDDFDMIEAGEDYQSITTLPFSIVESEEPS